MIMNDTVKIFCENTGANLFVNQGTSLLQVAQMLSLEKGTTPRCWRLTSTTASKNSLTGSIRR